ncbi:GNAT family N-acetyltransferase [Acinetobacter sp. 1000160]|uniref:GNAT family N-acetyltransferase n=1 Tax=Acinetobacter sp. 1000160 TaxID=1310800 RepID=UPI000447D684|nr:GNAT family N-acetyltransferase [Acinetobacter sp. 1000160]EXB48104.1 acetyltransferase family protein [Acinetobacter baumannii 146457]EYT19937.1 acetyltransferase family protein [Acinetobacter sp. 1000160]
MEEHLELTLMTLKMLSEQAGKPIDQSAYLASLIRASAQGYLFEYRNNQQLLGYFTVEYMEQQRWFIPIFVVHPKYRTRKVFASLLSQFIQFIEAKQATTLISHTLKNNVLSIKFHKRLGFKVIRENQIAFEFQLDINETTKKTWCSFYS